MLIDNKQIAIIGGGPGGLTLARLLELKGISVTVYERDKDRTARQQGATLDLHKNSGLKALQQAKLMDEFYANYRPNAGKLRVIDGQATIHSDDHSKNRSFEDERPEIDRQPLRNILLDALHVNTVVWDSHFVTMEKEKNGWLLHFKNGKTAYADLVIAADGANSKIRPQITAIQPIYSGTTIVEGNVYNAEKNAPKLWELVKDGKVFALHNEQTIILSAKGDGSLSFYTGCKVAENWISESEIDFNSSPQVFSWFKTEFNTWGTIWHELFASDELWFVPRPQYHFPLNQTWETLPNLTMLGDAAHRMPPYAGEGVNQAMQDALDLANCLTNDQFPNTQIAIAHYEKQMQKRSAEIAAITLESMEMMHSKNAMEQLLKKFGEIKDDRIKKQKAPR